ncbi:MAG TPA: tetratricopeptide repeat protein [Candidatus Limnocylindria bacterium]|nr:tetratricopeptide repeat protein [Candidatus Limnocylindria bacterium]
MIIRSKSLACWALVALLGAPSGIAAQTTNSPQKKSHRIEDSDAIALNNLLAAARAAMDKKDYAAAAQNYQDYLAKKPDDANIHFQLGYAYTALQRPADAKVEYKRAIDLDPDDPKMAAAYQNLGLTLIPTDPAAAIEPLQHAAALMPEDARTKWLLGVAFEASGKDALALEQYEASKKLDDKNPDIRNSLGFVLLRSGRIAEAETQFRESLAVHPTGGPGAESHKGLAQVLIAEKKPELAVPELRAYLEIQPKDSSVRVELASLFASLGRNDEALTELERAGTTGNENLRALKIRARIYFQTKRYDDAVTTLEKATTLAPQDADIPAQLGHVCLEKKDYPKAVRVLTAAWKMSPGDNDILGDLIAAEYLNKNYPAALQGLDVLSKRKTLPLGTLFIRATCYDKLGQVAQALEAYQQFLSLNKDETSDMYFEAAARARFLARELKEKKR